MTSKQKWAKNNPEKVKASNDNWLKNNKEKYLTYQKKYRIYGRNEPK